MASPIRDRRPASRGGRFRSRASPAVTGRRRAGPSEQKNAPANRGVERCESLGEVLRPLRIDLGVVALGVPFVDDIVDRLDVAFGVKTHLAEHGVPFAGLD